MLAPKRARRARRALLCRAILPLAASLLLLAICAAPALATNFTVNSAANTADRNPGDGFCSITNQSTGACTLRAAIEEVNALAAGAPHTIRFNLAVTDAARNMAVISVPGALPAITRNGTTIDGTTEPNNNTGTLGVGGTVGTGALSLSTLAIPDVEIVGTSATAVGFDISANSVTIRGLAIYGFGTTANSDTSGNIRINANITGTLIERNVVGSTANSFPANYAGAALSIGDNIRSAGGDTGVIQNNLIGFSAGKGIQLGGGATGWTVVNNEVRGNGIGNSNLDGIDIENGSGGNTVRGNLFNGNEADGIDMYQSSGTNTLANNTITRNGIGPNANVETAGIRVYGTGNTIDRNIITGNYGAGVMVTSGSTQNLITLNSIYNNGTITNKSGAAASNQIGIDLLVAANNQNVGTSPFVTPNGASTLGGNNLLNFPVITGAFLNGTTLTLNGTAPAGAGLEFFISDNDPSGYGEGQTYLTTLTEGSSPADLNATSGSFTFRITAPAGVAVGTKLTATAIVRVTGTTYNTSEFSGNRTVTLAPNVTLDKCVVSGAQCLASLANVRPNTELVYRITFSNTGGPTPLLNIIDVIPFSVVGGTTTRSTEFKVGSMTFTPGTSGLALAPSGLKYWNDPIGTPAPTPPWTPSSAYTPAGAPGTFDSNVSYVGWVLTGNMATGTSGTVTFTVRVK